MTTKPPAPPQASPATPDAPKAQARPAPDSPRNPTAASTALVLLLVFVGSLPLQANPGWDGSPKPTGNPSLPWITNLGRNQTGSVATDPGAPGTIDVVGGGRDVWGNIDEVTLVHTEVTGDFQATVRVEDFEPTHPNSKAGIMVRESLAEDSRMFFLRVTPPDGPTVFGGNGANTTRLQWRTGVLSASGGGGDTHNGGFNQSIDPANPLSSPPYPNAWLRLTRSGNVFTAQNSNDGETWHLVGSVNTTTWGSGPLPPTLQVGLAACAAVPWNTLPPAQADASFRSFSLQRGGPAPFTSTGADSRGNPKGIEITFNEPTGPTCLDPNRYSVISITPFQGFSVGSVQATPDPAVVRLNLGSALTEGRTYTITVFGTVADPTGQQQGGNKTFQFVHGAGYEEQRIHSQHNLTDGYGNNEFYTDSVAYNLGLGTGILGSSPVGGLPSFESAIANNSFNENFAETITGIFVPPATGSYTFYLASDDSAALYITPDGVPTNRQRIAHTPGWTSPREWNTDRFGPGVPNRGEIRLEAGKPYILEGVGVEGFGGNHLAAHVQAPGAAAPGNGDPPMGSDWFIPSRFHSGQVFHTLGNVVVTTGPENQSGADGAPVTFRVTLDGTPPWTHQWSENGVPMPSETAPTLTFPGTLDRDGNTYSVTVGNRFSTATSPAATLTVLDVLGVDEAEWGFDVAVETSILGSNASFYSSVRLTFSRRVSDDSLDPSHFSVDGITPDSVHRGNDETQVILRFFPTLFQLHPRDATVPLAISGVTDEAGKPLWLGLGDTIQVPPRRAVEYSWDDTSGDPLDPSLFGGAIHEATGGVSDSGSLNLGGGGWGGMVAPDVAGDGRVTVSMDADLSSVQGGSGEWSVTVGPEVQCTLIPPVGAGGHWNFTISFRGYVPNQPFAEIASEIGSHAWTGIDLSTGQNPDGLHRIRITIGEDGRVGLGVGDQTVFAGVEIPGSPPPPGEPWDLAISGSTWNGRDPVRIDNLQICANPGEPPYPYARPGSMSAAAGPSSSGRRSSCRGRHPSRPSTS